MALGGGQGDVTPAGASATVGSGGPPRRRGSRRQMRLGKVSFALALVPWITFALVLVISPG